MVGLPLTIAAGTLVGSQLFPAFSMWEVALLAALLAPTDAALGQSVVSAPAVPVRIRQAINVESGLNDGIALPAVLLLASLASAAGGTTEAGEWIRFGLLQVTLGPLAGIALGTLARACWMLRFNVAGRTNHFRHRDPFPGLFMYVATELIGGTASLGHLSAVWCLATPSVIPASFCSNSWRPRVSSSC